MAYTTGLVATFYNKVWTSINELIGVGDGSNLVFGVNLVKKPLFLNSLTIKYTIATVVYTATSDTSGVITGTNISSGSVREDGILSITFSVAPDDGTNVYVETYKSKGLLEKLKDFVLGTKTTETIGTGDGTQKIFSGTLSNTPIAQGCALLTLTTQGGNYYIWDKNGEFTHGIIKESTFSYTTGEYSIETNTAPDNGSSITIEYVYNSAAGHDWFLWTDRHIRNNSNVEVITSLDLKETYFRNGGTSGKEDIFVGIRERTDSIFNVCGWELCISSSQGRLSGAQFCNVSGRTSYDSTNNMWTLLPIIPLADREIKYYFFSNKNRIIVIARVVSTVYESCYLGFVWRLSSPSRYANPLFCAGTYAGLINYSNTSQQFFISLVTNITYASHLFIHSFNDYWTNQQSFPLVCLPRYGYDTGQGIIERDGNNRYILYPCYLGGNKGDIDSVYAKLDNVFLIDAMNIASEDEINVGTDTYILFQNIDKTGRLDYMAIKKE